LKHGTYFLGIWRPAPAAEPSPAAEQQDAAAVEEGRASPPPSLLTTRAPAGKPSSPPASEPLLQAAANGTRMGSALEPSTAAVALDATPEAPVNR